MSHRIGQTLSAVVIEHDITDDLEVISLTRGQYYRNHSSLMGMNVLGGIHILCVYSE